MFFKKVIFLIVLTPFILHGEQQTGPKDLTKTDQNSGNQSRNIISKTVPDVPDTEIITLEAILHSEPTFDELCKSIIFTKSGITCYFKHVYNCPKYAQEIIPLLPFKHLEEFILHGQRTHQPEAYTKAVVKLFEKKINEAPYVSATELLAFLQKMPLLLPNECTNSLIGKDPIKQLIRFDLENHFDFLKSNPDGFLDQLSQKIVARTQLNYTFNKLIDTSVSKVTWCITDQQEIWNNFLALGQALTKLQEIGIIANRDELDSCQWALTNRFCFFLSLPSSERLSLTFFEHARNDITSGIKHLRDLPEQEELMTDKTHFLQDAVINAAARADARQKFGIVSEDIMNQ